MIALFICSFLATSSVVEMVEPNAHEVSIQALIKLPKLGAKDLAKLEIIARAIPRQTEDYPRREMLVVTGGQPVRCEITPDVMRISEFVQPDNVKAGLSLMESLVRRATLLQDNLDASALEFSRSDYWSDALNPTIRPIVKLSHDEAQTLYNRVVRPERLLLAVGGKIVSGEAQDNWEHRMESWNPGPEPKGYFDISTAHELDRGSTSVTTLDLAGDAMLPDDAAFSTQALAMFALGSGKGASLFRIVREKHAWSYRQEAILLPTIDGWQPHLLIASIPSDETAQRADTIKAELLDDIKSWTDADLARAVGMADAVLMRGVEFSPLYVLGTSPARNSLGDRTYMAGYWQLKTGKPWNPAGLLDSMRHVTLEDLKDHAMTILQSSKARILSGG